MHIHRKVLVGVATLAMPLATIAVVGGTTGVASAQPITCAVTATVNFAAPGLTASGTPTTNNIGVTTTSGTTLSGGAGCTASGVPNLTINTKNPKNTSYNKKTCAATPSPNVCDKYTVGSVAAFAAAPASILKAVKNLSALGLTIKNSAAAAYTPGEACGSEYGFGITGTVKAPKTDKGDTTTLLACLGGDTGPGTTDSFSHDLAGPGVTIVTATIDPRTSSLTVS